MANAENNGRPVRAYQIVARNADGNTVSATLDLMSRAATGMTREAATMELVTAIIKAKGSTFIESYAIHEIY